MTIGEFAERARLSPKALRIYADLGLVVPAEVDPASGYRLYDDSQLERARMVALLRRLDMPLAVIARLVDLDPRAAARALTEWWGGVEQTVAGRRAVVTYLQGRWNGEEPPVRDVAVRHLPERKVLSISRHVVLSETDAFFQEAFSRLRAAGPGLTGVEGVPFLVFYGEVSDDSDGPIELSRPVRMDADVARPAAGDGIQVRVEPAHDEAYIRLREAEMSWPAMLPFWEALERWAHDHDRRPLAPLRQVLIGDRRHAEADTPVCDLSIPLR